MDLIPENINSIILLAGGSLIILRGFRIIKPNHFKNKEEEDKWFRKYGLFLKITGIFCVCAAIAIVIMNNTM